MPPHDRPRHRDPIVREVIGSGILLLATVGVILLGFVAHLATYR